MVSLGEEFGDEFRWAVGCGCHVEVEGKGEGGGEGGWWGGDRQRNRRVNAQVFVKSAL